MRWIILIGGVLLGVALVLRAGVEWLHAVPHDQLEDVALLTMLVAIASLIAAAFVFPLPIGAAGVFVLAGILTLVVFATAPEPADIRPGRDRLPTPFPSYADMPIWGIALFVLAGLSLFDRHRRMEREFGQGDETGQP